MRLSETRMKFVCTSIWFCNVRECRLKWVRAIFAHLGTRTRVSQCGALKDCRSDNETLRGGGSLEGIGRQQSNDTVIYHEKCICLVIMKRQFFYYRFIQKTNLNKFKTSNNYQNIYYFDLSWFILNMHEKKISIAHIIGDVRLTFWLLCIIKHRNRD